MQFGLHEGYLSGIEWIEIQELLEKNADKKFRGLANNKNNTVLSGILRCKCCGAYMRPKSGSCKDSQGNTKYYYSCIVKERTRGLKCQGENVYGNELDKEVINKVKEIFVPNSQIYTELKNMSFTKESNYADEINSLEKSYAKNEGEIKGLVDRMKYIDIDVIDVISKEIKKLKEQNKEIEQKISKLKQQKEENKYEGAIEQQTAKFVLDIIDNCFNVFDSFDLKYKKDLLDIFIDSAYGNGDTVEINLLNTSIEDSRKKVFYTSHLGRKNEPDSLLSADKGSRCPRL